jgi:signal transduction histidine kinase
MNSRSIRSEYKGQGRKALAAFAAGLCVFAAVVASVTLALRLKLRAQIVGRDAAVLASVAVFEVDSARYSTSSYSSYYTNQNDEDRILEALLDVSRLEGVVALRVFDADGVFLDAAPTQFIRGEISPEEMAALRELKTASRYLPDAKLDDFFYNSGGVKIQSKGSETLPLLEILVPIHEKSGNKLEGVGQFLLDGSPTKAAFAQLDRNLFFQAGMALFLAFVFGGGLLGWAFWKMHHVNTLLVVRTRDLARANRELALRSRVSAIGTITANLLHGLKNPLAALSTYVEERRKTVSAGDEALDDADEAVRRMGSMIEESVSILGQDETGERFDYTISEICEVAAERCRTSAKSLKVDVAVKHGPEFTIDNRRGNLLALALVNLVQNAVDATPEGGSVTVAWTQSEGGIILKVSDTGCGLPENMRPDPFHPVKSCKKGGSGIGLAIAAQLAGQAGVSISLAGTGPSGTTFSLAIGKSAE